MPLRENELARRGIAGLELRAEPLRVKWEFPDLVTSDGHELRCQFTAAIHALPDRTERRMLEELLLEGRTTLSADDVARHFFTALRGAATRIAQAHDAQAWIETETPRKELIDAIKKAAGPVAFASGVEFLPPFQADFQSPTFERQRVRAMQQALVEKEAAGQVEHFHRAAELLRQFEDLRKSSPALSAGRVLEEINPADRGSLVQALLLARAKQATATLWAVAGPYLVRADISHGIDGRTPPRAELFPLPPTLGPLRSVQLAQVDGEQVLLVGAQHGFFRVQTKDPGQSTAYVDGGFESPLGFNRVVYWPGPRQFCASHSEAGIVAWERDTPDKPARIMRAAALGAMPAALPPAAMNTIINTSASMSMRAGGGPMGPRNLGPMNGQSLAFSVGGRVMSWDGQSVKTLAEASGAEIVSMVLADRTLIALHEDGMFCAIDASTGKVLSSERRFGRIRATAVLPWLGEPRLLLAGDEGPVQCIGLDDPLVTQYYSAHRGLRVLAGSAGVVAAVSPDRQRVLLWNTWEPRQPAAELFLGALAKHRIADVTIDASN